jgi:hypothetical protein
MGISRSSRDLAAQIGRLDVDDIAREEGNAPTRQSGNIVFVRDLLGMPVLFQYSLQPDTIDEDGEELPDDKTAWKEATVIAGEMFRDIDGKLSPVRNGVWK